MAGTVSGQSGHVFGLQRPSTGGDYTVNGKQIRDTHFRELPAPTGTAPYRLDLKDVISAQAYDAIVAEQRLTFHLNGDIGSTMQQDLVATGMETDLPGQRPASVRLPRTPTPTSPGLEHQPALGRANPAKGSCSRRGWQGAHCVGGRGCPPAR
jgi:hypothetical protein